MFHASGFQKSQHVFAYARDGVSQKDYDESSAKLRGTGTSYAPLRSSTGELVAYTLRTKGTNRVYVSTGHKISPSTAIALTVDWTERHVPEPTFLADEYGRKAVALVESSIGRNDRSLTYQCHWKGGGASVRNPIVFDVRRTL